ncbi:amino acid adenylation domain-containing protein [Aquimarina brevivitae]|uniref:Amino acid adenylation domain-containing protein n=1 Tax=Aquimarina brevivitae TaxID=323412 RepID=A0A4Q7P269_9FLAO|nr:amino acid adenylation domain-containing protein [Aquimarina brevivitae]RZS93983.1 amino acid adenylation domain-containing protein [Aquimarina brevivitae]
MEKLTQFLNELLTNHNHQQLVPQDVLTEQVQLKLDATICGRITLQTLQQPDQTAIIDGTTSISYSQLAKKASDIAGELHYRGIQPGALVGVCMGRSWELVATLIGVMQAGCAYVPLDPAYPQDRVRYMLTHSKAVAAITDGPNTAALCDEAQVLIPINEVRDYAYSPIKASTNWLAYVIYTSGSTGRPKGVAVEHKSVRAMSEAVRAKFTDRELQGVFAGASVCFDTSVMELMGTLSQGGTVILGKNALELTQLPALAKIKTCVMVASAVQALLAVTKFPEGIECLVFGGEALKSSLVTQIHAQRPDLRILNAYGPTEDTVYSTIAEVTPGTKVITIGTSVPNSRAYILDEKMRPVANEDAGELYLAGTKLARGYLYDEELTKERFIEMDPTDQIPDRRLYKTGDLCRWTTNKEIEFLGRVDQQVKIRGFRIELEEIEATLETMPDIDAAAAAAVDGGIGQKMLAVYIVTQNDYLTEQTIKSFLSDRLPSYMVPQIIKRIAAMPVLPNDKLDRQKLTSITETISLYQEAPLHTSAVTATEESKGNTDIVAEDELLATIKTEVASLLNLSDPKEVQSEDSFYNLGLDSLTTLEFSCRLSQVLGFELSANALYEYSTPKALVHYISSMNGNTKAKASIQNPLIPVDSLKNFQTHIQSSHPTFQAAKANAWDATDKSKLVQEVMQMVNDNRRNPYSKVLKTGSATKGIVGDAYNDEEQEAIIWTTNLYLGLNRDPQVIEEASAALQRFGTGMGTSAAASGMTNQHLEFEKEFADLVGKPSACLFPTGYTANVGAVAGLLGKNDVVVIDQLCHASIVDGARLCGATIRTFQHNNAADLEAVLQTEASPYKTILVVLEGVYSMGEGAAPVATIVRTAKKYNALVLVDEAHSFGFYGEGGAGICAAAGITDQVDFIMTTLSKALGSLGGVVAASKEHVDLLKSSSRAYIFQASISPADMAAALTALRRLRVDDALRARLWETTRYMRQQFEAAGYDLGTGDGPIVTPHFKDKDKLYAIVQHLYQQGIQTSAVTYPIVESGRGRLRLICSAAHTKEDVDKTLAALIKAEREVDAQLAEKYQKTEDNTIADADVAAWCTSFTEYLNEVITTAPKTVPDLAIEVRSSASSNPYSIVLRGGSVRYTTTEENELPTCSLLLKDQAAIAALQASDVQGLLDSICKGNCVLNGQIEPFIWFVGRIVDQRKMSMMLAPV